MTITAERQTETGINSGNNLCIDPSHNPSTNPSHDPSTDPCINSEQWQQLQLLLEDEFNELMNEFVLEAQQTIAAIEQAHLQADNTAGREQAHFLKGASANLGANQLAKQCQIMEEVCKAGMVADAHNVVADINAELKRVITEIHDRLEG